MSSSFKSGSTGAGWGKSLTSGSEDEPTDLPVGLVNYFVFLQSKKTLNFTLYLINNEKNL